MAVTQLLGKTLTVAGVVATTLLLGGGTADAGVGVGVSSAPGGVDVWLSSWPDAAGPAPDGWCTYTSTVQGDPAGKPLPAINVPFYFSGGHARLWFPSYPTGATWDITIYCPNTGPQYTTVVW